MELKFKNKKPDLIICDSIEDIYSIENEKYKTTLDKWFKNLIYPLTLNNTKVIFLSKYLWENSFHSKLLYDKQVSFLEYQENIH